MMRCNILNDGRRFKMQQHLDWCRCNVFYASSPYARTMISLLLTAHDYRTPRKANMHFIADQLALRGPMRFFSLRYSMLSARKKDARLFLDDRANRVETVDGVDCFLWKTRIHPFNTRRPALRPLENLLFRWSMAHPPATLVQWMREADVIFFESGTAIVHVALAEAVAPGTPRVYIASDDLDVIDVADFVKREFARVAPRMKALCLPSPLLKTNVPASANKYFVPHGLDETVLEAATTSPYPAGSVNAVSVGSMLFDLSLFEAAASRFPDVDFHVIGSGMPAGTVWPANVRVHDEMPYRDTIAYIKHATVGIAPYRGDGVSPYLADTSMKLMQYGFFGIPAVCPAAVVGRAAGRFGYEPGSSDSIGAAFTAAFAAGRGASVRALSWSDVTDRLIDPAAFADTRIEDGQPPAGTPVVQRSPQAPQ